MDCLARRIALLFVCFFCVCQFLSAQISGFTITAIKRVTTGTVSGYVHAVKDNGSGEESIPVSGAQVEITSGKDTLKTQTKDGIFTIEKVPEGKAVLYVHKDGYFPFVESITVKVGDNLLAVELLPQGKKLDASVVSADAPLYTMKGDTLVYNASAVKTLPGDYAIDILRQMPGAEVSNFGIKIGGKTIARTYVNGILIFGRDPVAAVRNIAAEQVLTMAVYDEKPIDTVNPAPGQTERVMDIRTKDRIFDVTDIQALLAGGAVPAKDADGRIPIKYAAGASGNFYSENLQVKATLNSNNVGQNQYNGMSADSEFARLVSDKTSHFAAASVDKHWGRSLLNRTTLKFGYTYGRSRTTGMDRVLTEYFQSQTSPHRTEDRTLQDSNTGDRHNVTLGLQGTIKNTVRLNWDNSFNYTKDTRLSTRDVITKADGMPEIPENSRISQNSSNLAFSTGLSGSFVKVPVIFRTKFDYGDGSQNGWIVDTLASSANKRYLTKDGNVKDRKFTGSISYRHNFSKPLNSLKAEYAVEYDRHHRNQIGLDLYHNPVPVQNAANTFNHTYSYLKNSADLALYFGNNGHIGLKAEYDRLLGQDHINPADGVSKGYFHLLPSFRYLHILPNAHLTVELKSAAILPSLEQARHHLDDSRPLNVIGGNPQLKSGTSYNLQLSYLHGANGILNNGVTLETEFIHRPIVAKDIFFAQPGVIEEYDGYVMPAGGTYTTYENAPFGLRTSLNAGRSGNFFVGKNRSSILYEIRAKASYSLTPQYFAQQLSNSHETGALASGSLRGTVGKWFRFAASSSLSYGYMANTVSAYRQHTIAWNNDLSLTFVPAEWCTIDAGYTRSDRWIPGRSSIGDNYLHASAAVHLLGRKLSIELKGLDLVNSPSSYSTSFAPDAFIQTYKALYGRYLMLGVKYRFNSTQKTTAQKLGR